MDPSEYYFRTTQYFATGLSDCAWLNSIVTLAAREKRANKVLINVYEVT